MEIKWNIQACTSFVINYQFSLNIRLLENDEFNYHGGGLDLELLGLCHAQNQSAHHRPIQAHVKILFQLFIF